MLVAGVGYLWRRLLRKLRKRTFPQFQIRRDENTGEASLEVPMMGHSGRYILRYFVMPMLATNQFGQFWYVGVQCMGEEEVSIDLLSFRLLAVCESEERATRCMAGLAHMQIVRGGDVFLRETCVFTNRETDTCEEVNGHFSADRTLRE